MDCRWGGTRWGRLFTRASAWSLTLESDVVTVTVDRRERAAASVRDADCVAIVEGRWWSQVIFRPPDLPELILDGIPNDKAKDLVRALAQAREASFSRSRIEAFCAALSDASVWRDKVVAAVEDELNRSGWLTRHLRRTLVAPGLAYRLYELLQYPDVAAYYAGLRSGTREIICLCQTDLQEFFEETQKRHADAMLHEHKSFLDRLDKHPVTEEQGRAIVTCSPAALVIAAAGSGKSTVIAGKAVFTVYQGRLPAEQILILMFNSAAAEQLRSRLGNLLARNGFGESTIAVSTFHAFGRKVLGEVDGRFPTVAPWIEKKGADVSHLSKLVEGLKRTIPGFRNQWDLLRFVFDRDLNPVGPNKPEGPDGEVTGFRTLGNELVKTLDERVIADWLFYNGVEYQCIEPCSLQTTPLQVTFFYPAGNLYHEHRIYGPHGGSTSAVASHPKMRVLSHWDPYPDEGKFRLQTFSEALWDGRFFPGMQQALASRGLTLNPDSTRPTPGRAPMKELDLVGLFRTALTHAISNNLSANPAPPAAHGCDPNFSSVREDLFWGLFKAIRAAWDESLANAGSMEFDDMINKTADHIEAGRWDSPYRLVMVDEFQDTSQARFRLLLSLMKGRDRQIFAVGDDWQAINGFAGADPNSMVYFERHFASTQTLYLTQTFRCPQLLCDVASEFVQENPNQFSKRVTSAVDEPEQSIEILVVQQESAIKSAIRAHLLDLYSKAQPNAGARPNDRLVSVYVLGRYQRVKNFEPYYEDLKDRLQVKFLTVHAAKGLEADHVIIPNMSAGVSGFPCLRQDDSILRRVMRNVDGYPLAEERRLLYVALTRARRSVLIITPATSISGFAFEIARNPKVRAIDSDGKTISMVPCLKCGEGRMVERSGRYGTFLGCSRFPRCR